MIHPLDIADRNEWRETLRDIYDRLHFKELGFFSGDPLAKELIGFIEDRHPGFFNDARDIAPRDAPGKLVEVAGGA